MNAPTPPLSDAAPPSASATPPTSQPSSPGARFTRIDVLRAVAALSVVGYHLLGSKIGWHLPWSETGLASLPDDTRLTVPLAALSYGWVGVPLFFALSGFCIHGAFLRQPVFSAGVFFWRRFWRIYPPFAVALAVFCFWPIPWLAGEATGSDVVWHLTTAFTLSPEKFWGPFNPSFWSVAVEFQCYLLYPVLLLLRARFGIARAAFGWFGAALLGSIAYTAFNGWPDHAINYGSCVSLFSFGGWALGALVAEDLATGHQRPLYRPGTLALSALACALSALWRPTLTWSFPLAALTGALLIVAYANRSAPVSRGETLLSRLGLASYSLYLWHQPLLGPLEKLGRELAASLPLNAARLATYLVIVVGLALITIVSYRLLEIPGMKIASQLRPKKSHP